VYSYCVLSVHANPAFVILPHQHTIYLSIHRASLFGFLAPEQEAFVFDFGRHIYLMGWKPLRAHPPPKLPFQCPHQTKKGSNLLLFGFCIHLHTYQDLKLKCCRVMGQKLRYGRPCTHDLPGTHNWLAQPHIASISSEFHQLSHAGIILEVWSELLLHWLTTLRLAPEHVCL
jgi:hypothetical protein